MMSIRKIYLDYSRVFYHYTMYDGPRADIRFNRREFTGLGALVSEKLKKYWKEGIIPEHENLYASLTESDDILEAYLHNEILTKSLGGKAGMDVIDFEKEFRDSFRETLFSLVNRKKCIFGLGGEIPKCEKGLLIHFINEVYQMQGRFPE